MIACGQFGCVYKVGDDVVVKIGKIGGFEIQLAVFAASVGIGPHVYNAFPCRIINFHSRATSYGSVYVMERLGKSLEKISAESRGPIPAAKKLIELAVKCLNEGLLHRDLHQRNILSVVDASGKVVDWRVTDWDKGGRALASMFNRLENRNFERDALEKFYSPKNPAWIQMNDAEFLADIVASERFDVFDVTIGRIVEEWMYILSYTITGRKKLRQIAETRRAEFKLMAETISRFDFGQYIESRIMSRRTFVDNQPIPLLRQEVEDFTKEIHREDTVTRILYGHEIYGVSDEEEESSNEDQSSNEDNSS
jgi:hypothetical protein